MNKLQVWEIMENMIKELMSIIKEDFFDGFKKWKGHWDKYLRRQDKKN